MNICQVPYCSGKVLAKGYCQTHYDAFRKYGDTGSRLKGKKWTEVEDSLLKSHYSEFADAAHISELAKQLGRSNASVHLRASRLGLGDRSRPRPNARTPTDKLQKFSELHNSGTDNWMATMFDVTPTTIERWRARLGLKKDQKKKWEHVPHPRGFAGGKHNEETLQVLSEKSKAAWSNPSSRLRSKEESQRRSNVMSRRQASGDLRAGYSRGKMGRRADLGDLFFRSSWEANYARYLNFLVAHKQIEKWEYEPETFWFLKIKRGVRSYKPDFKVWERGRIYYIEVKGWMDTKSATKIKRMRLYYSDVELRVIDQKQYRSLKSKLSGLIPNWE